MIRSILEALGLRRAEPESERVQFEPPRVVLVPEGAEATPAYRIRSAHSPWQEIVTLDVHEALKFERSSSHTVRLCSVYKLPDGRVVWGQEFKPVRLLGVDVDVVVEDDGTIVERVDLT